MAESILNKTIKYCPFWLSESFTKGQAWLDVVYHSVNNVIIDKRMTDATQKYQFSVSEIYLVQRWKWSRNKVRRFLQELNDYGFIKLKKTFVGCNIIVIYDFDKVEYQQLQYFGGIIEKKVQVKLPEKVQVTLPDNSDLECQNDKSKVQVISDKKVQVKIGEITTNEPNIVNSHTEVEQKVQVKSEKKVQVNFDKKVQVTLPENSEIEPENQESKVQVKSEKKVQVKSEEKVQVNQEVVENSMQMLKNIENNLKQKHELNDVTFLDSILKEPQRQTVSHTLSSEQTQQNQENQQKTDEKVQVTLPDNSDLECQNDKSKVQVNNQKENLITRAFVDYDAVNRSTIPCRYPVGAVNQSSIITNMSNLNQWEIFKELNPIIEGFDKPLIKWMQYKDETESPVMSKIQMKELYNHLISLSNNDVERAAEIVSTSIACGYKSLVLKTDYNNGYSSTKKKTKKEKDEAATSILMKFEELTEKKVKKH